MSSNCKKCGKEFSYGRQIYHECKDGYFYFGSLFEESKKENTWNCLSSLKEDLSKSINCLTFEKFVEKIKFLEPDKIMTLWNKLIS